MVVNGDAADVCLRVIEREAELVAGDFKDVESDFHDFRTDTITGENCEFECFHINLRKNWKSGVICPANRWHQAFSGINYSAVSGVHLHYYVLNYMYHACDTSAAWAAFR